MNLPDDYGMYWRKCFKHNVKYHMSDGGCDFCIRESQPQIKTGDAVKGCLFVNVINNTEVIVSETYAPGFMCLDTGCFFGLDVENGKLVAATYFKDEEQARNNGYNLFVDLRDQKT
jgi:hypothetical protein